jgi:hypothetical protein
MLVLVLVKLSRYSWGWLDSNQRIPKESDLQSDAIGHYATPPKGCWRKDLNPQPSDYKSDALPVELLQQKDWLLYQMVGISEHYFFLRKSSVVGLNSSSGLGRWRSRSSGFSSLPSNFRGCFSSFLRKSL